MKFCFILISFFSVCAYGQDLKCDKFKEGVFYIPFDNRVDRSYYIFRNKDNQVEVDNDKNETYLSLVWNNDCSYTAYLKPESAKEKIEIAPNLILDSTVVKFIKTNGDTLFYRSTSFFGKKELEHSGRMIRIGDVPPRD